MANHKSALKRIKLSETRRLQNKYKHKTARNAIKKLKDSKSIKDAQIQFPIVVSLIDKLSKNKIIHKNKAANLKSKLSKLI